MGIGQLSSMDDKELLEIRDRLLPFAEKVYEKDDMDMIFLILLPL